jgi:hypothetical protein
MNINFFKLIVYNLYILVILAGCGLQSEIDLEIPDHKGQPMVECYLEPGKPFRLV